MVRHRNRSSLVKLIFHIPQWVGFGICNHDIPFHHIFLYDLGDWLDHMLSFYSVANTRNYCSWIIKKKRNNHTLDVSDKLAPCSISNFTIFGCPPMTATCIALHPAVLTEKYPINGTYLLFIYLLCVINSCICKQQLFHYFIMTNSSSSNKRRQSRQIKQEQMKLL